MASFVLKKTLFWSALILLIGALILALASKYVPKVVKPLQQDISKPLLVWIMRAYVPNMTAGAEITCHVTNKQLLKDGFEVTVIVKHYVTDRQDGVKILKSENDVYDATPEAKDALSRASVICIQNLDYNVGMDLAKKYRKPVCFFIHATSRGKEFLGYAGAWPIHIVYNSWSMKADIGANYKNYVLKPYVDLAKFKPLASAGAAAPRSSGYVTLINLNKSKGGDFLIQLAKAMPEIKFLGVEGGYGDQIRENAVRNITYMSKTDKIEDVYAKSSIVIMPSDLETWGRVAVEAMASGVPVIVNDVQGMREACQEGALIANRNDIAEWIRLIRRLRDNPLFYSEQVQKGQQRIRELEDDSDMKGIASWLKKTVIPSKPSHLI
jgi:glycosyltransferase involved in cell wall biosynthesis